MKTHSRVSLILNEIKKLEKENNIKNKNKINKLKEMLEEEKNKVNKQILNCLPF